ncbi:MAG: hypothetical protein PHT02_15105 [Tissierellia bacterium]|nr:hypothetical protein [Tissierellia bacterium]
MYLFGQGTDYVLIECDKCRKVYKYDKSIFKYVDNYECVVQEPIECKCGNISQTRIFIKPNDKNVSSSVLEKQINKPKPSKFVIFIIGVVILGFISLLLFPTNHNDGKCDICKKEAYTKLDGDGGEYCQEHYMDALEHYMKQLTKDEYGNYDGVGR